MRDHFITEAFFLPVQPMASYPTTVSYPYLFIGFIQMSRLLETRQQGEKQRNQQAHQTLQFPAFDRNEQWHTVATPFCPLIDWSDLQTLESSRKVRA